ncbi:MAG: ATP-binding protein [Candidatus Promineofilum sp.]|nr:ATP-binding protein [Promineifilum sp.]
MSASDTEDLSAADPKSYHLSGDFRGAIVNIESTFVNSSAVQDIEGLPPEPGNPPYKGLQYFDEADAEHFLGREALTARLSERLRETRFLAVIGASGSGKSSLVRAGLVPALRRGQPLADGALPPAGSDQWLIRVLTPTTHPLDALAVSLLPDAEPAAVTALRDRLAAEPGALAAVAPDLLGTAHPQLFLVVDQFEELFSLTRHEEERQAFIDNLVSAVTGDAPVRGVIVLRADFYDRCAQYEGLRELVSRQQEYIGAMSRNELFRVIVLPAVRDNWKIQEGLVDLMLDDVGDEPGALPLLSHALLETWQRRRGRTMTLSGYKESGGVRGAIAKTAETVFRQRLTAAQQPIARMIFMRLTELGESADSDTPDTRRRALFSELITRSTDTATLEAVLSILVDSRLVMTDFIPPGEIKVVEVCHEALIREWPTLRDWLNQDRQGLIRHRQLTADVNDWLNLNRDPGALYRGAKLEQALAWTADPPDPLSVAETEFLDAGRVAVEEEARRAERLERAGRNQRILIGLSVLLLLGVVAAVLYSQGVFNPLAETMTGDFKVAVAEFAVLDEAGRLTSGDGGRRIAERIGSDLALESSLDLNVWFDGPASEPHVPIGVVGEGIEGAVEPAERAEQLDADMIVYGTVEPDGDHGTLTARIYARPLFGQDFSRVIGNYDLVSGIPVFDLADPSTEVWQRLDPYARAAARLMLGLRLQRLGDEEIALSHFERAVELVPDLEIAHYFIGQGNLYLAQQDGGVDAERLAAAESAFARALAINADNARAQIGAGSIHYLRAQAQLDASTAEDFTGDRVVAVGDAVTEVELALQTYEPIAAGPEQLDIYGVPIASLANYEAGIALRLLADAQYRLGSVDAAQAAVDEAISRLTSTLGPLVASGNYRQIAQAHQALGTAYEWRGFLLAEGGDPAAAAEAYGLAITSYEACAAVQEQFRFDFMVDTIVGTLCRPRIEALKQFAGGG